MKRKRKILQVLPKGKLPLLQQRSHLARESPKSQWLMYLNWKCLKSKSTLLRLIINIWSKGRWMKSLARLWRQEILSQKKMRLLNHLKVKLPLLLNNHLLQPQS